MPVTWNISHEERLMTLRAEGPVRRVDVEAVLDAVVLENAFPYAKLFDARGVEFMAEADDVMLLGARLRAYAGVDLRGGPVAFVADPGLATDFIKRYLNLAGGERPAKIFTAEAAARRWLNEQRAATKP